MQRKRIPVLVSVFLFVVFLIPQISCAAGLGRINAKSAILIDMDSGSVLFEQNPDTQIPPASITKILTLYLVFESIKEGQVHLWDKVEVSRRAASTGGSRMGLKAGTRVPMEELIKGMAVVSGNDACVAAAEHISGSVERFVLKMNAKARELGMTNSRFLTPNGLPAPGQVTTARDIAKLSTAYLHRFPESLTIHSMQAYCYGRNSHHNANRLLGRCPGVDGLKTGFVCASGYNISATAKRNGNRILAVVMGARTPWIRLAETEKLIEAGFRGGAPYQADVKLASTGDSPPSEVSHAPASAGMAPIIRRQHMKSRHAKAAAVQLKRSGKTSLAGKSPKVRKALKAASTRNGKKYGLASSKPGAGKGNKSTGKIGKSNVKGAKSVRVASAGTTQASKTKAVKASKSTKSAKQSSKKAISKKKTPGKSQAAVMKKKSKG